MMMTLIDHRNTWIIRYLQSYNILRNVPKVHVYEAPSNVASIGNENYFRRTFSSTTTREIVRTEPQKKSYSKTKQIRPGAFRNWCNGHARNGQGNKIREEILEATVDSPEEIPAMM
jgi:hypothetical protein